MLKDDCRHEWQKNRVGKYTCSKCGEWELADKVFQRESLKHQLGFEKWMAIIAFVVSVAALAVALFK